jgi:peptide/nickel transport system ATP-binding protein
MAISCRPKILIADEPTTALDVTVQAQIFELMRGIQEEFGVAIVLITHDMGAIAEMADRVAVMYAGRIIEEGRADDILDGPLHPYTRGLIDCIPALGKAEGEDDRLPALAEIPGVVPPLHLLGEGCAFADRCALVHDRCRREKPLLKGASHCVACHANELEAA